MTTTTKQPKRRTKKPTKRQMELVNEIRNLGYALYYHVERGNLEAVQDRLDILAGLHAELDSTYKAAKS